MYARVATFEGDPGNADEAIKMVREQVESGEEMPGLEGAKMMMLVDRASGKGLSVTLYDSEEAEAPRRRGAQRDDSSGGLSAAGEPASSSTRFPFRP